MANIGKNHFSTIGLVGMNEACLNLFGENIASRTGHAFAVKMLDFMRSKLIEFQDETGNNYNLEATSAEATVYRLARRDKEKYPEIVCANEEQYKNGAEPFYTNSTHLPVNYTDDVFEAFDLQDELQTKYTGGTVLHIFVGEEIKSPEAIKNLVRKICENYRLPYFTVTPVLAFVPRTAMWRVNIRIARCVEKEILDFVPTRRGKLDAVVITEANLPGNPICWNLSGRLKT